MNDTFLSIENATGVSGWEIRAGLCRFPPTGRGARLTTNLWSIKKMTDASGDVCSLSPEVSVYSCLWMICPWWLFEAGSEFIWLQMKSFHSHTVRRAKTPASHSDNHHPSLPTNGRGREAILQSITVHYCLSVRGRFYFRTARSYELADAFILFWWSTLMPPGSDAWSLLTTVKFLSVFYVQKLECRKTKNEHSDGEWWRKHGYLSQSVSSGFSLHHLLNVSLQHRLVDKRRTCQNILEKNRYCL